MNMAFIAGFLFVLQTILLMDMSAADPLIDARPTEITLGTTSTLDINCTFFANNHPGMAAFVSLVLSRANATGQDFLEIAAITEFSPDSVTLLTSEKVTATGVHSQTGESFLHLTWEYPTELQAGVYKCSAIGIDMLGHNVEMTNTSLVTVGKADLNDVFEKLKLLEMSMKQQIQTLENEKTLMETHINNLEHNISRLEVVAASITGPHVDFIGSYGNKDYYVSSYAFTNINKSIDVCKSLGGQLAVVNDQSELTAIQKFLKSTIGIYWVYISGSDEKAEGNWVLSDSDTPLPFTSWYTTRPATDRSSNCLMLISSQWTMYDSYCHIDGPSDHQRFMCEI